MKKSVLLTIVLLIACTYATITNDSNKQTKFCGTVLSIPPPEAILVGSKSPQYKTERYIVVRFNNKITEAVLVDATTYYTAKVNNNICFDFEVNHFNKQTFNWGEALIVFLYGAFLISVFVTIALWVDSFQMGW